jgi:hypothetical protein
MEFLHGIRDARSRAHRRGDRRGPLKSVEQGPAGMLDRLTWLVYANHDAASGFPASMPWKDTSCASLCRSARAWRTRNTPSPLPTIAARASCAGY